MKIKRFLLIAIAILAVLALSVNVFADEAAGETLTADLLIATANNNADDDLGGAFSGARWAMAGKVTLIGLLIVFSSLAVIWLALEIFHVFTKKSATKPAVEAPAVQSEPAPVAAAQTDDLQLIAVITAAVAAYRASDNTCDATATGFRVVSFKKVGQTNK